VVARLGPGVRIKEVGAVERTVGQGFDQRASVAVVHPNIVEPLGFDCRQKLRHSVYERLCPNETDVRMKSRLMGEMFAAAESDLEPNLGL